MTQLTGLTLETLQKARPFRPSGAPDRANTHRANVYNKLNEREDAGVFADELYNEHERYGRSPRNRISELRASGVLICGEWRGKRFHYRLLRQGENQAPSQPHSKPAKQSGDFFEGQRATGLPLF